MSRTITQIEHDIDNSVNIKILEYLKDYLAKQLNVAISDIDGELQKIFTEVQGLDKIVSVIPKPLEPAATDPTTSNDGDLFFNTTDKWFKYYQGGTWHNLAHLDTTIDAYTKAEADSKFATKSFDYSDVDSIFTKTSISLSGGGTGRGQNIAKPQSENAPTGTIIKLKLKDGNTIAGDMPIDTDGFYYDGYPVWRTKGSDIANYSEIKAEIAAGKIMVATKQADGSLVLEPWENAPVEYQPKTFSEPVTRHIEFKTGKASDYFEDIFNLSQERLIHVYYRVWESTDQPVDKLFSVVNYIPNKFFTKSGDIFTMPHSAVIKGTISINKVANSIGTTDTTKTVNTQLKNQWENNFWDNNNSENLYGLGVSLDVHHNADGFIDKLRIRDITSDLHSTQHSEWGQYTQWIRTNVFSLTFDATYKAVPITSTTKFIQSNIFLTSYLTDQKHMHIIQSGSILDIKDQVLSDTNRIIVEYQLIDEAIPEVTK